MVAQWYGGGLPTFLDHLGLWGLGGCFSLLVGYFSSFYFFVFRFFGVFAFSFPLRFFFFLPFFTFISPFLLVCITRWLARAGAASLKCY